MEAIGKVLEEAQLGSATHQAGVKKILAVLEASKKKNDILKYLLNGCLDRVLVAPKSNPNVERVLTFLYKLIGASDEATLKASMEHLSSRFVSTNKLVRQRALQAVHGVLSSVGEEAELSCDLLEKLSGKIIIRMKDKIPAVRVQAVRALKLLQDPDNEHDVVTNEIVKLMNCDATYSVRVAAIETVSLTEKTLISLVNRLRDVKAEARIATLTRLHDVDMRQLNLDMRSDIIHLGLMDRDSKVTEAAKKLVLRWLSLLNNNVQKLLSLTNPLMKEDIAQQLGVTVMESFMTDSQDNAVSESMSIIKEKFVKWSANVASINPSEILWVYIRCAYVKQNCASPVVSDIFDCLLPDAVVFCRLISAAVASGDVITSSKRQFVVKYLIKLAVWTDSANVSGRQQFLQQCTDMLNDASFPSELVDVTALAYQQVHDAESESPLQALLNVTALIADKASSVAATVAAAAEVGDNTVEEDEDAITNQTERALQLLRWVLQRSGGNQSLWESIEKMLAFVLSSLQQPVVELRCLAVDCLGLMCAISSTCGAEPTFCAQYRRILLQVVCGDFEEESIRREALMCLTDISLTNPKQFTDDVEMRQVLLRMQDSVEPSLIFAASECAAKLLFAGEMHEPNLFANLVRFFFLSELLPQEDEEAAASGIAGACGGADTSVRLQQLLSLFFPSILNPSVMVADPSLKDIVLEAMAPLVATISSEMKDSTIDPSTLNKVIKQLFSICIRCGHTVVGPSSCLEDVPSSSSSANNSLISDMQTRLAAAVSLELLKLGAGKVDKSICKEYVKILQSVNIEDWVTHDQCKSALRMLEAVAASAPCDKTSLATVNKIIAAVTDESVKLNAAAGESASEVVSSPAKSNTTALVAENCVDGSPDTVEDVDAPLPVPAPASASLFQHAPGLADLVELVIVASVRKASAPAAAARSTRQLGKGKKLNMAAASSTGRNGESDSEDQDSDEDENEDEEYGSAEEDEERKQPVRRSAGRQRKLAKDQLSTVQEEEESTATALRTIN